MTPVVIAMVAGAIAAILAASVVSLTVAVLSPTTGLLTLAAMTPLPRPLAIPTPGLYVALIGAILLGLVFRLPIERPRMQWPTIDVVAICAFLVFISAQFLGWLLDGPVSPRASAIASLYAQVLTAALTFIAATLVLRGRSPYPVLAVLLVSATFVSAMAMAQSVGADGMFGSLIDRDVNPTAVDRSTGPFSDPNYFGAYLAAATTLGVACAAIARSIWLRLGLIAISAFAAVALALTLSRGGLVALLAGLLAIAFSRGRRVGLVALIGVLVAAAIAWPSFADVRFAANPDLASAGFTSQLESSGRIGAWLSGIDVFLSAPLFGVGWGRFVEEASSGLAAHNWYIALAAESGIVGFLLWLLFIASAVLMLRRKSAPARTVGFSVLATSIVASMFIEAPVVYGSIGLVMFVLATAISAEWEPREWPRGFVR